MADWVITSWDTVEDRFIIPGPAEGAQVYNRFHACFPDDADTLIIRASATQETLSFKQLPQVTLRVNDSLVLPGIPVAAGPLLYVMSRLLGAGGCPWDQAQTSQSLIRYLLDESYEAAEALVSGDDEAFADELGDVLLQIAFHGAILADTDFSDIAARQARKLVRRHPHVFAQESWESADEVRQQWEAIKAREDNHQGSAVWVYPALAAAKRLAKLGIEPDSPVYQQVLDLLQVYLGSDAGKIEEILADAAWAVAAGGRIHHQDAEWALWKKMARTALEQGVISGKAR